MKSNIVRLSDFIERGKELGRLDAEFVDAEVLGIEKLLTQNYSGYFASKSKMEKPENYARPKNFVTALVKYIAIDDIDPSDGFLFHQELPEQELPSWARHVLRAYDILVSNVRPERGAIGIVLPGQAAAFGSSGLSVLRVQLGD